MQSKRDWTGIDPVASPFFREGCHIVTQGGVCGFLIHFRVFHVVHVICVMAAVGNNGADDSAYD